MKRPQNNYQNGFTIIELLVVMIIMLVIMAATFSLLRSSITTANANFEMTTAAQGLRNSQEFINRDILGAGDGFKGTANIWLPTQFVRDYLTVRTIAEVDPTNSGYVSIGSILSDFNVPENTKVKDSNPATTVLPRTDRITMLISAPDFAPIDIPVGASNQNTGQISVPAARINDFTAGEVYYITSEGTGAFGTVTAVDKASNQIFWAEGDALKLNRFGPTGPLGVGTNRGSSPATLKRVNIIHYFADAQRKLIRRVFGVQKESFIDSVIAEHLTALTFRYVLKPLGTNVIFDQPKQQIDLDESSLVRLIEPHLRIETAYALQDGQKHELDGVTQIGVRNVQFLEAPVPVDKAGNTELPNPGPTPVVTPTPPPPPPPPPTPVPTPTPKPTSTPTPTPTPTPNGTPTKTPTPTPTKTPTPTPTKTPTPNPTPVKTPTPGKGDG